MMTASSASYSIGSIDSDRLVLRSPRLPWPKAAALGLIPVFVGVFAFIASRDRPGVSPPLPPGQWQLSSAPTVRIGDEAFSEVAFGPITTLLRTSDSTIAAHDLAGVHIRMVSLSGHLIGRVGGLPLVGRKPMPGEFERIAWAAVSYDTLYFYDDILRRLTAISPEGDVYEVRQWATRVPGLSGAVPLGRLRDGQWVLAERPHELPPGARTGDVARNAIALVRVAAGDSAPMKVASVLGPAVWRAPSVGGHDSTVQRFGPRTLCVVLGDEIWIGDNAGNVIIALDANGREQRRISLPLTPQPLGEDIVAEAQEEELRWTPNPRSRALLAELYRSDRLPQHPPNFASLFVSADSLLWVELWSPRRRSSRRYLVYAGNGQLLAALETPPGFRITDAGADWALGVYVATTDIEGVRMYALRRR